MREKPFNTTSQIYNAGASMVISPYSPNNDVLLIKGLILFIS